MENGMEWPITINESIISRVYILFSSPIDPRRRGKNDMFVGGCFDLALGQVAPLPRRQTWIRAKNVKSLISE